MTQLNKSIASHSNAYNLFIVVMTVFSLFIMVVMLLPLGEDHRFTTVDSAVQYIKSSTQSEGSDSDEQ